MATQLGMNAKLYYKAGGVAAGGDYTELGNVRDVTFGLEKGEADVTTRANNGWRARTGTLKDGTLEFEMVWDTEDDGFTALKDAFLDGDVVGMKVLDEEDGSGLEADFEVFNFSRTEPLEEAIKVSVSMKIARSETAPVWIDP